MLVVYHGHSLRLPATCALQPPDRIEVIGSQLSSPIDVGFAQEMRCRRTQSRGDRHARLSFWPSLQSVLRAIYIAQNAVCT